MTPAITVLKKQAISHEVLSYTHDPGNLHYGAEAVEKLGLTADQVFKTLLVSDGQRHYVAIVPVMYQLNLKKAAHALGCKKLDMAAPQDAERLTGYQLGGISPLGQKKRLPTVIDASASHLPRLYVSGGRRGLELALAPADLAAVLGATFSDIADR